MYKNIEEIKINRFEWHLKINIIVAEIKKYILYFI